MTLKQPMMQKKVDDKKAQESKNSHKHLLHEGIDRMKNTQFKVEDVFGDILGKESNSNKKGTELDFLWAKMTRSFLLIYI